MSLRGRRRSVERRLRRHEMVSIDDIVQAFCVLERTATGLVPAEGSIEAVRRKVADAAASSNLLIAPVVEGAAVSTRALESTPEPREMHRQTAWYVVAVADDADFVQTLAGATVIRRVPGALLASASAETAYDLRGVRPNLHVYDELAPAVAAFRLFDSS
jgi:hypothetical protein